MTKELSPLRRKDIETGRQLERKAVVAYLEYLCEDCNKPYGGLLDDIDTGEHVIWFEKKADK